MNSRTFAKRFETHRLPFVNSRNIANPEMLPNVLWHTATPAWVFVIQRLTVKPIMQIRPFYLHQKGIACLLISVVTN
jgi:hypothetical protein